MSASRFARFIALAVAILSVAEPAIAAAAEPATGHVDGSCVPEVESMLARLTGVLREAERVTMRISDPRFRAHLILMVPAEAFDRKVRTLCAHSGAARKPDLVRMVFNVGFDPLRDVDPGRVALAGFVTDQYVSFREADDAYHAWTANVGDRLGTFVAEQIPGDPAAPLYATWAATNAQVALGLLALGPDLVCLPESVALSPWQLAHGYSESLCGIYLLDGQRIEHGTSEQIGAVTNILAALTLTKGMRGGAEPAPRIGPPEMTAKARSVQAPSVAVDDAPSLARSPGTRLVPYDEKFAAQQDRAEAGRILQRDPITPNGRQITIHASKRMVAPGRGRVPMTPEEVDHVLDTGTKISKVTVNPKGQMSITVARPDLPGKPKVVVDESGSRVITVIKNTTKK